MEGVEGCKACGNPITRGEVNIGGLIRPTLAHCNGCGWSETPQELFEFEFLRQIGPPLRRKNGYNRYRS